ncbi:MAG: type I glyceraldehyde-3-phosphate dehydrogenase [Clostridia bacterium]|nr:type I glyceraldehyde-3-phosphate dehydrogenase [Clostridia bacterium]
MVKKIAINGFGRIGRNVFRIIEDYHDLEVVAVNDLTDAQTLGHLLKYDSVHGQFAGQIAVEAGLMDVQGQKIKVLAEKDPSRLPWRELGIDIVIEATGHFTHAEQARAHLEAGAQKVLITAPAKEEDLTIVLGVNEAMYDPTKHQIISCASCTTNCLAPLVKVVHQNFTVKRGMMTTVHSYTNDQQLLDLPHRDLRRARAAGLSIIPTTTGAARAVTLVLPELQGKLNGFAMRVPTPNVSVVDFVAEVEPDVTSEQINACLKEAANGDLKGILGYSEEPLVSKDYYGDPHSSIVDALSTMVVDGNMIKVVAWYDNEWGYSCRVVDLAQMVAESL